MAYTVHFKETYKNRHLDGQSHHHVGTLAIGSRVQHRQQEIQLPKKILKHNGYPAKTIKTFQTQNTKNKHNRKQRGS